MRKALILSAMVLFAGCLHEPEAVPEPLTDLSMFYYVWEYYEAEYPLFAHKEINWMEVGGDFYPIAAEIETEEDLYMMVVDMLGVMDDPALYVKTPDDVYYYPVSREYQSNVDEDVLVSSYLVDYDWSGFLADVGYCDPTQLPYLCYRKFPDDSVAMDKVDTFLALCIDNDVPAIILDVRMNPTSFVPCHTATLGRFLEHSHVGAVYRSRIGPLYNMYYDSHPAFDPCGPRQYSGTVYVLAGEECQHVAEDLVANMEYFPNAVIVGDSTSGNCTTGTQYRSYVDLDHFWEIKLGTTTLLTHDYEWIADVGVAPDIYVEATEADFAAGVDPVLEHAMELVGVTN